MAIIEGDKSASSELESRDAPLADAMICIAEILDLEYLRKLLESFSHSTGYATALVIYPEQELVVDAGLREVCDKYHRAFPQSKKLCALSRKQVAELSLKSREPCVIGCQLGLMQGAIPVVVEDAHVATLLTGQVFFEKPSLERYAAHAERFGYDRDAYLASLNAVPVVAETSFRRAMTFLYDIADMIGKLGWNAVQAKRAARTLEKEMAERRRAEEKIRESESKLRLFLEGAGFPVVYLDNKGKFEFVNRSAAAYVGTAPDQFTGKSLFDLLPQEQAQKYWELMQDRMTRHRGEYIEDEVWLPGGTYWFRSSVQTINDAQGKVVGVQAICMDITDRKMAEQKLRESEERYRLIVDHAITPIEYFSLDGRLQFINSVGAKNLGGKPEDFIGKFAHEFIPQAAEGLTERTKILIESRTGAWYEDEVDLPGEKKWFLTNYQPMRGPNGELSAIQLISIDITDRKKAELELERLRNLLANVIDSMPSILVGVDGSGRVNQWNRQAQIATGVSADQARGRMLGEVFPALADRMGKVRSAVTSRTAEKEEKAVIQLGGEYRLADVTVYPLISNGVDGAVILVEDVTERVRVEEMMIQSEKMLSLGGMAAGMAHEIFNPLSGVLQSLEVVLKRVKEGLPQNRQIAEESGTKIEAVESYMEKRGVLSLIDSALESSRRAVKIVDNTLSFSRKSEGQFELHDLRVLLDNTVELAASDYELDKNYDFQRIEIVREYRADTPEIWCDGAKIQQVFFNLLKNSAQAMADGHVSRGETPRVTLRLMPDGDMVRVEIEDNGPGMKDAVRKRAFEPFFTTKGPGIGTGLGLPISYFIVTDNHRGTMAMESTPGAGTKFIIRLPIKADMRIRTPAP